MLNTAAETCVRARGDMVYPDAVQVQQSSEREHKHEEGDHGRDDLKRDRARVGEQVMLFEPSRIARHSSRARSPICRPCPNERAAPPAGGRADATLRELTGGSPSPSPSGFEFRAGGFGRPRRARGSGLRLFEVLPPVARYGVVVVIDSVVIVELPLALVRDQPQNADVRVGHDRGPPGSGTGHPRFIMGSSARSSVSS